MKTWMAAVSACAGGLALALSVSAWASAAAQPAPAQLPNWKGIWMPAERNLFDPTAFDRPENKGKDSAAYMRLFPPYNAEWEARYLKTLQGNVDGLPTDPTAACLPGGMPRIMTSPYPMEFEVTSDRVAVLLELNPLQVRRIYTDGRGHPPADELEATYMGHSIGRWEGDTLVVDTVGLRSETVFDVTAAPHSDKMHVTERIRRVSPTLMENIITVEDPVAFTRPWQVRRTYRLEPTWTITEYVCNDNNRNPILPDGTTAFLPPLPKK